MDKHTLVVVTCNRLSMLTACLEAVLAQTRPYDHVVVVDNASTDGTREFLQGFAVRPGFTVLLKKQNTGGAGGFETGLRKAVEYGDGWITLIDDDCILRKDFLEEICRAVDRTGGQYAAYAGVPLTDGIRPGHRRRVCGSLLKKETAVPVKEYEKESFTCEIASFCGLVVSAEAVRKTGFPRKDFFIWYDDTEYSLRLSRLTPILNWNRAVIDHRAGTGPSGPEAGWKDYYGIRNRIIVTKLHYNSLTLAVVVSKKLAKMLATSAWLLLHGRAGAVPGQLCLYRDAVMDGLTGRTGFCRKYAPASTGGKKKC